MSPDPSYAWAAVLVVLGANTPPNAPAWVTAQDQAVDSAADQVLDWDFSDPDPGDTQSEYVLDRWTLDATGARVGSATRTTVSTPVTQATITGGTLSDGKYEFKVATRDAQGAPADDDDLVFSESLFVTFATAPTAATITAPANNATVAQTETLTWSTPTQDAYQVQILDGSTAVYDTDEVTSSSTRSLSLSFPDNNTTRTIRVRVKDGGLWSPWASISVSVSWTAPADPTCTLTAKPADGARTVAWTNPTPGTGEPTVSYVDVYCRTKTGEVTTDPYRPYSDKGVRLATMQTGGSWEDALPCSDVTYEYLVRAVATNGTTSDSGWVSTTT